MKIILEGLVIIVIIVLIFSGLWFGVQNKDKYENKIQTKERIEYLRDSFQMEYYKQQTK